MKEEDCHYLGTGILTKSEAAGGDFAMGNLTKHLLADTGGEKSKDVTSMPAVPDVQQLGQKWPGAGLHQQYISKRRHRAQAGSAQCLNAPRPHTSVYCSRSAISYSHVKGPALPPRSRSEARQP